MAAPDREPPAGDPGEALLGERMPANLAEAVSVLSRLAGQTRGAAAGAEPATEPVPPPAEDSGDDRALRLAEARYRALVEQIPAVVFLATVEGGHQDIYVSPQIESLLGFTQREWTSDPVLWYRQLHPDDRTRLSREFAKTCTTGQPFHAIARVFARDGTLVWVHAEARLVRDEGGRPLFLHGVGFDVTEQHRAQQTHEQLLREQQARSAAEEASRLRDEFLATLSHELRTPLSAIVGWTHILQERAADASPDVRKAVDIIARNAQVQNQLISDILDVSRIIAGKLVLEVRPVDLAGVVAAALDTVRPAAEAKEIELLPVLDPAAGPVSGDADRLQQVIWNLLSNAIKFSPEGGRIEVRLEAVDSHVELVVEDTGPGVDPEFMPYLFERFRQADASNTRAHGGLGLGLAIVRHLAELHGGSVNAANRESETGAVFTLRLPRRSAAASRTVRESEAGVRGAAALPSLAGLRLLVVDDEPDAREMVKTLLERHGARVTVASSTREALEAVERRGFDVLISDIGMPGEDGYSLMRRIRDRPSRHGGDLPAVALTAYASEQDRLRSLDAGFQTHLAKPVQPHELVVVTANLARLGRPSDREGSAGGSE